MCPCVHLKLSRRDELRECGAPAPPDHDMCDSGTPFCSQHTQAPKTGKLRNAPLPDAFAGPPARSCKTEDMDTQDDLEDTRGWRLAHELGQQVWGRACRPPESGQMDGDARR